MPSQIWVGPREGYVFTTGGAGTGYYKDREAPPEPAAGAEDAAAAAGPDLQLMRTVAEMRRERGLAAPVNPDSLYRKVERPQRLFNPLKIPKNLQARLPYKTKPKQEQALKRRTLDQKRQVLMEKPERKAHSLLQMLNTIRNEKAKKRRDQQAVRRAKRAKAQAKEDAWRAELAKETRKRRYIEASTGRALPKRGRGAGGGG